jgi:hypothetical protein
LQIPQKILFPAFLRLRWPICLHIFKEALFFEEIEIEIAILSRIRFIRRPKPIDGKTATELKSIY